MLRTESVSGGEDVAFSMNGQMLVAKLGRSSTRSPRYLVLVSSPTFVRINADAMSQTNQAVYIAITQLVQGRPQTTLERKIPLTTLIGVQLSNLKDDWIVSNLFVKYKSMLIDDADSERPRGRGRPCVDMCLQD